jgi:hypothetical protein
MVFIITVFVHALCMIYQVCIQNRYQFSLAQATIRDEPVVLLNLSLAIHTLRVEKKPLLSLLFIKSSSGSEEGGSDLQMTPELLNGVFSAKSTQYIQSKRGKELYNTTVSVAGSVVTDTHTLTHKTTTVALVHEPRVNDVM